jgi:hypothetical protein
LILCSDFDEKNWNSFFFRDMIYFVDKREGILPKRAGVYKGEKRRKELSRQKKQEERRQRRLSKGDQPSSATEDTETVEQKEPTHP